MLASLSQLGKKLIGDWGENIAEKTLLSAGLKCVAKNYRCKGGEIDLVMMDGEMLVFVEVRVRKNARFGTAAESIRHAKQKRIQIAAQHFLLTHAQFGHSPCRFDAFCITGEKNEWIKSAFIMSS